MPCVQLFLMIRVSPSVIPSVSLLKRLLKWLDSVCRRAPGPSWSSLSAQVSLILWAAKKCPVIAAYGYSTLEEGVDIARQNLEKDGKGHSVSFHSDSETNIEYVGSSLCVSRFVINQVSASSAGGSYFNGLAPTNTLGCGSWGHNSISENLDYKHLMNVSRIARFMPNNHVPTPDELWK